MNLWPLISADKVPFQSCLKTLCYFPPTGARLYQNVGVLWRILYKLIFSNNWFVAVIPPREGRRSSFSRCSPCLANGQYICTCLTPQRSAPGNTDQPQQEPCRCWSLPCSRGINPFKIQRRRLHTWIQNLYTFIVVVWSTFWNDH